MKIIVTTMTLTMYDAVDDVLADYGDNVYDDYDDDGCDDIHSAHTFS